MWLGFYSGDVHLRGHCRQVAKNASFVNSNNNTFSIIWSGPAQSWPNHFSIANKSHCDLEL